MATLQIRDLDERTYQRLAARAKRERRSLTGQAAAILDAELSPGKEDMKERRRVLLKRIGAESGIQADSLPSPEALIREDRDR